MPFIRRIIIPKFNNFSKKTAASYNVPKFKESLTIAASKGKIDSATAIEHLQKVSSFAMAEKHAQAARYIDDVSRVLGLNTVEHTFNTTNKLR